MDPRFLNKAIRREHYQLPTLEDIATRLFGAKCFSKLHVDANHGYWQIPLDPESQLLTTFNSPLGDTVSEECHLGSNQRRKYFKRERIKTLVTYLELKQTLTIFLVWRSSNEEHNRRLEAVLQRCLKIGLTLNKEKCKFGVSKVTYLGHTINAEGISPDKEKIRAISEMPPPEDKKGVERLLGVISYVGKFIPNMSTVTHPIRELLRKDVQFNWSWEQSDAFQKVKKLLSEAPVLAFFDVKKPVTVSCVASQHGLGVVLL